MRPKDQPHSWPWEIPSSSRTRRERGRGRRRRKSIRPAGGSPAVRDGSIVPHGGSPTGGRIDFLGAVTLALFLVLLLLGISQGHEWGWSSGRIVGCLAGAAATAVVWVLVELRVANPLVDMRMFVHRQVLFTNLAGLFVGFAAFAQFIGISYLVQMPQRITGYGFTASVLRASVEYLLPSALIALVAAPVGGILVRRIGARFTLAVGALVGIAGFAWLAWGHGASAAVITAGMLTGIAISFGYAAMPALIAASVPLHQTGIANGINSISRSVGSSIASAVVTSLLASKTVTYASVGVALAAESQFTLSFVIAAVALLLAAAVALLGLSKHHRPLTASRPMAASSPVQAAEAARQALTHTTQPSRKWLRPRLNNVSHSLRTCPGSPPLLKSTPNPHWSTTCPPRCSSSTAATHWTLADGTLHPTGYWAEELAEPHRISGGRLRDHHCHTRRRCRHRRPGQPERCGHRRPGARRRLRRIPQLHPGLARCPRRAGGHRPGRV